MLRIMGASPRQILWKVTVALIVVLSSEAINWAEAYLLRWRPTAEPRAEREVY